MKPLYLTTIKIILIIIITFLIAKYLQNLLVKNYLNKGGNSLIIYQVSSIIYYLIISIGFVLIMIQIGVQKSTILTFIGTLGLTIGLSLQSTLSRCVSGIYIILENLYDIGDYINAGGNKGYVKKFNLFNTTLNENGIDIIVPNDNIDSSSFTNYTKSSSSITDNPNS